MHAHLVIADAVVRLKESRIVRIVLLNVSRLQHRPVATLMRPRAHERRVPPGRQQTSLATLRLLAVLGIGAGSSDSAGPGVQGAGAGGTPGLVLIGGGGCPEACGLGRDLADVCISGCGLAVAARALVQELVVGVAVGLACLPSHSAVGARDELPNLPPAIGVRVDVGGVLRQTGHVAHLVRQDASLQVGAFLAVDVDCRRKVAHPGDGRLAAVVVDPHLHRMVAEVGQLCRLDPGPDQHIPVQNDVAEAEVGRLFLPPDAVDSVGAVDDPEVHVQCVLPAKHHPVLPIT